MAKHARGRHRAARPLRLAVPLLAAVLALVPAMTLTADRPASPPPSATAPTTAGPSAAPSRGGEAPRRPGIPSHAPPLSPAPSCTVGAKLVPTCHVLWGAAAGGLGALPRGEALRDAEAA